jgi:hypothetical protein
VDQTLTAIKDDISKLRISTPPSPIDLLNNIVVAPLQKMSDTFRQRGGSNSNLLPRPPSGNHVLETGSQEQDFLSEQHFSKEQFSVDPLPPPSDMNTMNLFHLAAAANPNRAQAASRRPVSPSRNVATTPTAAKPLAKNVAGAGEFFANFKESDLLRPSLADKTPDAFNDFIEDFHFDREFAFSRLGQAPEEDEIAEGGEKDPEEKTTFGGFSLPTGIHKFADMNPPDWIKDSGW